MTLSPSAEFTPAQRLIQPADGLHIIANLSTADVEKLTSFRFFKTFIDQQIVETGLHKIGEVYHDFDLGGFTGVVCLSESHLSVHTWPERNYITFDVFLSNHMKDNTSITRELYHNTLAFFNASVLKEELISR